MDVLLNFFWTWGVFISAHHGKTVAKRFAMENILQWKWMSLVGQVQDSPSSFQSFDFIWFPENTNDPVIISVFPEWKNIAGDSRKKKHLWSVQDKWKVIYILNLRPMYS